MILIFKNENIIYFILFTKNICEHFLFKIIIIFFKKINYLFILKN